MRTFRTLLTFSLFSTLVLAQDLAKPSAALKDDVPVAAPAIADTTVAPVSVTTGTNNTAAPSTMPSVKDSTDLLIDRIIGREHFMMESMSQLSPMLETYVQNMKPDAELGQIPASDEYFLGRLDFAKKDT